jgi:hypothetical protein
MKVGFSSTMSLESGFFRCVNSCSRFLIAGVCSTYFFSATAGQSPGSASGVSSGYIPSSETIGSQDALESDREEEHESNGPEGTPGKPMKRLSAKGILLAVAVLLASASLAWQAEKGGRQSIRSLA